MPIFQHCKSCGGQISSTATSCPHCGHLLKKEAPEPKKVSKDWNQIPGISGSGPRSAGKISFRTVARAGLIAAVIGVGTYAMRTASHGPDCGSPEEAFVFSQGYVKSALKSPATADFPAFSYQADMMDCGRWRVSSYVDAQNSFGATLRSPYVVILQRTGSLKWVLESISLSAR